MRGAVRDGERRAGEARQTMTDDEGDQVLGDVDISTLSDSPGRLLSEAAGARVLNNFPNRGDKPEMLLPRLARPVSGLTLCLACL
jgi:hypothetical protein